jgi:quercetin dioxygenase-like cupin family protein
MTNLAKVPRRVVTGHKNGVATIIEDGLVPNVLTNEAGFIIADPWATNTMPVDLEKSAIIADSFWPKIPQHGSLFRYVVIPPDSKTNQFFEQKSGNRHALMHKTETLDYIIIISGELYLIMEDSETLLKPGDIVIQRATNHAWSNRSDQPCVQLAILLDAKQPGVS